jgi:hypothetical protein
MSSSILNRLSKQPKTVPPFGCVSQSKTCPVSHKQSNIVCFLVIKQSVVLPLNVFFGKKRAFLFV